MTRGGCARRPRPVKPRIAGTGSSPIGSPQLFGEGADKSVHPRESVWTFITDLSCPGSGKMMSRMNRLMTILGITRLRADIVASRARWQAHATFLRSHDWLPKLPAVVGKAHANAEQPSRTRLAHGPDDPAALPSPPVDAGMPRGSELLAPGDYYILGFRRLITWLAR